MWWIQIATKDNGRIVTCSFPFLFYFQFTCVFLSSFPFLHMMKNQRSSLGASLWQRHTKKSSFDRHRACLPPTGLESKPNGNSNTDKHDLQHNNNVIPIILVKCKQELLTRGKHSSWFNKSIFDTIVAEHSLFFMCKDCMLKGYSDDQVHLQLLNVF